MLHNLNTVSYTHLDVYKRQQQEEEETRRQRERWEEERKRREAFEEELKNAKKLKNEKRQIGEDLMKNGKNTNDKIEDDHSQKESMEPPQENMTKDVPEQDVNNDEKEEEVLIADPETETITRKDHNELYESPSEHSEVTNENIKTPYQKVNKGNDTTEENDEAVQEMVSDNAPTVNFEYTNINSKTENKEVMETPDTKTPEGEVNASDTIENQPKEPEPTELLSFQKMMMECRREQFPQPVENRFEEAREEMVNDIRLWREEIIQQWREEMETNNEQAEIEQGATTLSYENGLDRDKEINAEGIKKAQIIQETEELLAENEELEQNNLPICNDPVESKEALRSKNTEQANPKIKDDEEENEIINIMQVSHR